MMGDGTTVGYQLRHRDHGIFQGECLGMGFWSDISEMPEQGLLEFRTYEEVAAFRAFLCSEAVSANGHPFVFSDLVIEPFNRELSEQMKASDGNY